MNSAMKAMLINSQQNCCQLRSALFHSTPVLDRKRRTYWDSSSSLFSRRSRNLNLKHTFFRNASPAEFDYDHSDPSSSDGPSWFRRKYWGKGSKRGRNGKQGCTHRGRGGVQFCEDDVELETVFRSTFDENGRFYRSFVVGENPQRKYSSGYSNNSKSSHSWSDRIDNEYDFLTDTDNSESDLASEGGFEFCEDDFELETTFRFAFDENPQWKYSSGYSNNSRTSWNWRDRIDDEYDFSTDSNSKPDLASDRMALGLSASGPLQVEDVKNAYRACALKWHPDRHQGSSKVVAEKKFKVCSAAYQSLCDKLALA